MKIRQKNTYYIKAYRRESQFWEWKNDYEWALPKKVTSYLNRKKHGNEKIDDFEYLKSLGHFKKWLSIWSGWAMFELQLIKAWIVDHFDFLDISKKAHETLMQNAKNMWIQNKISTDIQDFNFLKLKENTYDLISCQNVLHHLINLEEALYEINKALNTNGIFVVDDFIGEKKMYRSDTKMRMIQALQTFLKERYSIETKKFIRTSKKVLTNNCPFECIRSDELYGLLQYYFWKSKIKEATFWHIFSSRWWILKEYDNPKSFEALEMFDDFVAKNDITAPQRIFAVYKKSKSSILKSSPWTKKEIQENIKVSRINEKFLLRFGQKIAQKMPWIANILKKLYFMIRK